MCFNSRNLECRVNYQVWLLLNFKPVYHLFRTVSNNNHSDISDASRGTAVSHLPSFEIGSEYYICLRRELMSICLRLRSGSTPLCLSLAHWATYQIRKIAGCACARSPHSRRMHNPQFYVSINPKWLGPREWLGPAPPLRPLNREQLKVFATLCKEANHTWPVKIVYSRFFGYFAKLLSVATPSGIN